MILNTKITHDIMCLAVLTASLGAARVRPSKMTLGPHGRK